MIINSLLIKENETYVIEDNIDFSNYQFDKNHIRSINNCHVKCEINKFDDLLVAKFYITCDVVGVCIYTLEDVDIHLNFNDTLTFSDDPDDDTNLYEKDVKFSVDDYVLTLILNNLPVKIMKKDATINKSGEGYRILTEDEYYKEKEKNTNPAWDSLDDLDLD